MKSRETRRLALEEVRLVFENIEIAYNDGRNHKARENMLQASYKAGVAKKSDTHKEGAEKFIEAIKELNAKMNIPGKFKGIRKEDIATMAKHAAKEANPLYPVPKLMNAKELESLYYEVADGR